MSWTYEPPPDLEASMAERLKRFPRQPDMLIYGVRGAAAVATRAWLHAYHRLHITGRENLPQDRSFIMVANHASHLDILCLLASLPIAGIQRAYPAAARDYFFENPARLVAATVFVNAIPFNRQEGAAGSIALCRRVLHAEKCALMIFPEGTRSQDGAIGEFRPGVGLLAAATEHPVVPCHLEGTARAWPKGRMLPRPRRVALRIGEPRCYSHLARGRESAMEISEDLRRAVMELARRGSSGG